MTVDSRKLKAGQAAMRFWVPVESSFLLHPRCRQFGYSDEILFFSFQ